MILLDCARCVGIVKRRTCRGVSLCFAFSLVLYSLALSCCNRGGIAGIVTRLVGLCGLMEQVFLDLYARPPLVSDLVR